METTDAKTIVKPSDIGNWKIEGKDSVADNRSWNKVLEFLWAVVNGDIARTTPGDDGYFKYYTDKYAKDHKTIVDSEEAFYLNEDDVKIYVEADWNEPDKFSRDTTRVWEVLLVALADKLKWNDELVRRFEDFVDSHTDTELGYAAFYTLCTYYRRHRNIARYNSMIYDEKYSMFRMKYPLSYEHLRVMLEVFKVKTFDQNVILVEEARELCQNMNIRHNIGPGTCFADRLADALEEAPDKESIKYLLDKYAGDAMSCIEKALFKYNEYVKFNSFKARIMVYQLRFAAASKREDTFYKAMELMHGAIDRETVPQKKIDYQTEMSYMQQQYNSFLIEDKFDQYDKKIADVKANSAEQVGIFAAIVGLLIVSGQIAAEQEFSLAIALIMTFAGCAVLMVAALGAIMHDGGKLEVPLYKYKKIESVWVLKPRGKSAFSRVWGYTCDFFKKYARYVIVMIIGLLLIFGGWWYGDRHDVRTSSDAASYATISADSISDTYNEGYREI